MKTKKTQPKVKFLTLEKVNIFLLKKVLTRDTVNAFIEREAAKGNDYTYDKKRNRVVPVETGNSEVLR